MNRKKITSKRRNRRYDEKRFRAIVRQVLGGGHRQEARNSFSYHQPKRDVPFPED